MTKRLIPLLCLIITGCASGPKLSSNAVKFDFTQVESIVFKLDALPDNESGLSDSEWTQTVSTEISDRFADAGFPVANQINAGPGSGTHRLLASVEETRMTEIQPGLTFDFGNSNPRAANFQKTLSAPISCTIQSLLDPEQEVTLKELKSIASPLDKVGLSQQQKDQKLRRFYIENIGSTCHNLLKKLAVKPTSAPKPGVVEADTFMPSIRIETKYKTDEEKIDAGVPAGDQASESVSETASDQEDSFPTITTEEKDVKDWRDAEITIFNQGDTVILEFGPHRR